MEQLNKDQEIKDPISAETKPQWSWKQEMVDKFTDTFFFGSIFRDGSGHFYVPCSIWDGSRFSRHGYWLGNSWNSDCRLVLLEV